MLRARDRCGFTISGTPPFPLLLALGVPPHVVREIVGHSDVKVTLTVYAHVNLDEKAAALSQLSHAVTSGLRSTGEVKPAGGDEA